MLADTNAEFVKALGLDLDLKVLGGVRSKRFSAVVEDGVIKALNVEPDGTGLTCSLADPVLKQL
jgi:2-Cys peroxiredoxin 5